MTDADLRKARQWAMDTIAEAEVEDRHLGYRHAACVILATVPAPPATLADELREAANDPTVCTRVSIEVRSLADRVEAVEKALNEAYADRDEAYRRIQTLLGERGEYLNEMISSERKQEKLEAEVERLTRERTVKESRTVASDLPDPADVPDGDVWQVEIRGRRTVAVRSCHYSDELVWIDAFSGTAWSDGDVTLIARLVPDTRRVIDRPEDLDKLPEGSVVLDEDGFPIYKMTRPFWRSYQEVPELNAAAVINTYGPVTVIHEPMVDSVRRS
ncbi:hypothetical protein BJF89_01085 [Corynebacterium sp. CNJ-954]|uniref:hypothetical protein n=1 Tax=Corynebacterium sp. CNJ-954 TaxID=1904962 RepID=UPI00095B946C|nr:hypothetical protein [Corynebacterium sp. CNJ-954]OLT54856.1 hypothetical protein BJF89_01085 [Corynebacterium sp. CNJ-954]